MNKFDYCFKISDEREVALKLLGIYKDLAYKGIDKNKVFQEYVIIDNSAHLNDVAEDIKIIHKQNEGKMQIICEKLNEKWQNYKDEYIEVLSKNLGIKFDMSKTKHTYCYLHLLPIDEINMKDNIICLNCNKSIEEHFKTFIIMLTKAILLDRSDYINKFKFDDAYDYKNKIWMFAEIALDAIFKNSDLIKICENPSYKYLYSLKIDGVNVMEQFRVLYTKISLDDFFTSIYMFVHKNYQVLLKFKNYLY